jgi:hypothetical protein
MIAGASSPKRDVMYWAKAMRGQSFTVEDQLDTPRFNRALWIGLKGQNVPYPSVRHGSDMRDNRKELLKLSAR